MTIYKIIQQVKIKLNSIYRYTLIAKASLRKYSKQNIKQIGVISVLSTLIIILLYNTAFSPVSTTQDSNKLKRYHFLHFGTTIQITLGLNQKLGSTLDSQLYLDQNQLSKNIIQEIDTLLKNLHYKWHPWRDGELATLNKNFESLKPFEIDQETKDILDKTKDLHHKSLGYFNPAIGSLVAYWGFHNDNPELNKHSTPDTELKNQVYLDNLLYNLPSPDNIITINNSKYYTDNKYKPYNIVIQNNNPYLKLDLSGFIKARAALKIKNILFKNKINNALINIGGDIYVIGYKNIKNKQPWIIATKTNNDYVRLSIYNNESIATSGISARKYYEQNTRNAKDNSKPTLRHHIINPLTGEPAKGFAAVTVIHDDPYISDAAATALLIAGEENYKQVALSMGVDKFILISNDDKIIFSEKIKNRINTE